MIEIAIGLNENIIQSTLNRTRSIHIPSVYISMTVSIGIPRLTIPIGATNIKSVNNEIMTGDVPDPLVSGSIQL